jgi:hypothetical protein
MIKRIMHRLPTVITGVMIGFFSTLTVLMLLT